MVALDPYAVWGRTVSARVEYVRLLVSDLQRSIRFYRDVLGLSLAFDDGDNYAAFDVVPGFGLSLFTRDLMTAAIGDPGQPPPRGDASVLVCAVESVDAEVDRLRDLGVVVVAPPEDRPDWGIRTAHLRDPDGYLLEINSPLP